MPEHQELVRIGIIGSGGYGNTARKYLRHTGLFNIHTCMDVNEEAARAAAEEDDARPCTDLDELLTNDEVEAVSINTPVLLHYDHARRSLEAGKHVFMTKPVTNDNAQAYELVELARENGLAFMIGHHARHSPAARYVGELLEDGTLGTVCNALVTCGSSGGLEQEEGDWRVEAGKNPGGPLLQCGIHSVDKLLGYFGKPARIMAVMQHDITPFDVADNTLTLMDFECGIQVTLISNYTTAYSHTERYFGTKANLHVHQHITGLGQREMYLQPRARGQHEPWKALRIPSAGDYPDPHGGVLERQFARQVRSGDFDYENARDASRALEVVEAAVESHRTGQAVSLS